MRRYDAARLARALMNAHGLGAWVFQFGRGKTRFGSCYYDRQTISLSEPLTLINDESTVRETILHEIAHAIAGPAAGHGSLWKTIARQVGARPVRCFSAAEVKTVEPTWIATCSNCGHVFGRHRRPRNRRQACRFCCRRHNGGRFSMRFVLIWKRNPETTGATR